MNITISFRQSEVFTEVARTTEYSGAKISDEEAYERIATIDEDRGLLQRFWDETRAEVARELIRLLSTEGMDTDGDTYTLQLEVSPAFDKALLPSMQLGLFSYFVQSIAAKWYVFTNKEESAAFANAGKKILDDVREKVFYKKPPTRPIYD